MQLALPVWLSEQESFESFISNKDDILLDFLKSFIDESNQHSNTVSDIPFCVIHSLKSNGKSHLLYASCHYASEHSYSHAYFDMRSTKQFPPSMLDGTEQKDLICIDNVDAVKDDFAWQVGIFDLLNRVIEKNRTQAKLEHKTKVLVSSDVAPNQVGFSLKDLASRLSWGTQFKLETLSDEKCKQALSRRAQEKGLECSDEVLTFLLSRINRDMKQLAGVIDLLDHKSLQAKRKLSIPFVKSALDL